MKKQEVRGCIEKTGGWRSNFFLNLVLLPTKLFNCTYRCSWGDCSYDWNKEGGDWSSHSFNYVNGSDCYGVGVIVASGYGGGCSICISVKIGLS